VATPTYDLLDSTTLSSSASSVTFSAIDQSYRDLVIVYQVATTGDGRNVIIRFNSDSTGHYAFVRMKGNGSTATSASSSTSTHLMVADTNAATTNTLLGTVQIMDYSATDKHKTALARVNQTTDVTFVTPGPAAIAARWPDTSAITNIEFSLPGDQYAAGCTFSLYGISA